VARSYGRLWINHRVMVNLTTDKAISGVLWDDRGPLIVLRDATLVQQEGTVKLDGEVVIERSRIDFVQIVVTPEEQRL
jgi:small nuclear ribonucleoprotein (snRNP)-like protein